MAAYLTLPTDSMGSLTDQADLEARVGELLHQLSPFLPPDASELIVGACLVNGGRTDIGDPSVLGSRNSAKGGWGRDDIILLSDRAVAATAFRANTLEISREVAARLLEALAERR